MSHLSHHTPNPWVTPTEPEAGPTGEEPEAAPAPALPELGPQPHAVDPPRPAERLPVRVVATGGLWVVGVHGGAGESTVAGLLTGAQAAGHAWPVLETPPAGQPGRLGVSVLLVARTSTYGLQAVQSAAREWASGEVPVYLLGLVLVADAPGRLPRTLRDLRDVVTGGVPRVWHVPWMEAWRRGDAAGLAAASRGVRRMATEVHALIGTRDAGAREA